MLKLLVICSVLSAGAAFAADQPTVRLEPMRTEGPRPLQKETAAAAVRGYLGAWASLRTALEQNRPDLLDADFVGTARDQLGNGIEEQVKSGIHTRYLDRAHDLQIVFYSPEGLSIQLVDNIEYDVQVLDRDKVLTTQRVRTRYIAVLSPSEVRWRVRILQTAPE